MSGRLAYVTGGMGGIVTAICRRLCRDGYTVVAGCGPGSQRKDRWVADMKAQGLVVHASEGNVADWESTRAAFERVRNELGPVDVLVNNAGIVNNIARIAELKPEAWEHELRVNLSGAFHTTRVAAPAMAKRGWGRVINLSSVAAATPGLGQPAYAASKAGVIAFTQATAQEFGRGGVTANAIMPGLIATPLVLSMPEPLRARAVAQLPIARLGTPADIGALAAFLASPAAGFITGVAIPCDGGLLGATLSGLDG